MRFVLGMAVRETRASWQRLIFFEMDEPKDRHVTFHVFGS